MLQPRSDRDLALEPLSADLIGERRIEHLEGDVASVPEVSRQENHRAPTATCLAPYSVTSCQRMI